MPVGIRPVSYTHLDVYKRQFHLAESNFAAAFVSDCLVKSTCDSLVFYKIDSELTTRLFYVLLPNRHYTSCAAKMFIQYILTQL